MLSAPPLPQPKRGRGRPRKHPVEPEPEAEPEEAVIEWVGKPLFTVGSDTFYGAFAFEGREDDPIRVGDAVSFRVANGHYDVNPEKVSGRPCNRLRSHVPRRAEGVAGADRKHVGGRVRGVLGGSDVVVLSE
jgi:hypothetical protein